MSVKTPIGGDVYLNKRRLQQAFLQSRFYLLLRGIFHALQVPECARKSLGTLPEAIYDMISHGFAL